MSYTFLTRISRARTVLARYASCTLRYASWTLLYAFRPLRYASCTLEYAFCTLRYVSYTLRFLNTFWCSSTNRGLYIDVTIAGKIKVNTQRSVPLGREISLSCHTYQGASVFPVSPEVPPHSVSRGCG
jgi:hypothetical protein